MKKLYLVFVLGILAMTVTAQNLVLNGGFETWGDATNPTGWTKAENIEQETVAANVHSGTSSAKHTGDGTKDLSQTIAVEGGKTYTLSLWYKNEGGDGSDCRIWSNWKADGANLTDDEAVLKGPGGTSSYFTSSTEWQQYAVEVTAPATATDIYFEVRTYTGAITYWDDFVFEEVVVVSEPDPLFFSEYIEGSSNNKALEIYNPGPGAVDLANYQIAQTSNGSDTTVWEFFHVFPEGATIEPYDVWVILNSSYETALFDFEDADEVMSFPSPVHHNGDDARAIVYITATDTIVLDLIGTTGDDPGSGWDVAGVTNATANHTLVRKDEVSAGTDDWLSSAGSNADDSQWIVHPSNESSYLGWHGPDMIAPKVTLTPAEGAVSVSVSTDIVFTFNEPVLNLGGTEITDPASLVVLKETDASGADVAFTATISAEKEVITITPDAALTYETAYYAALNANVVEDTAGNALADLQSATFTTIGPLEVSYPAGGEVFYPGEDIHIDWTTDLTENLSFWVSFDAGASWEVFLEDIDPALGTVDFTIPLDSEANLDVYIRISKATDVTFADVIDDSESFAIVPMLSINDIQSDVAGMYTDTICLTSGVVVFADDAEYYISDGEGDYSGVVVRDNVNKPAVGDSIVIAGSVVEYYNLTQIDDLISFTNVASGKPVPAPVEVTTGGAGEALEGVIVTLKSAVVVKEANSYGEVEVDDGTGVILTDDVYYEATLNLGGTYDITGPLSYSYGDWRVYPTDASDIVVVPSSNATVSSDAFTVDNDAATITDVPATTDLATLKAGLTPAYGAAFEVYQADGTTVATDLATDYKVIVTAEDGTTEKTYTITLAVLSSDATVTSLVYTVDDGAETIAGVLFKSTLASFEALLVPAPGASFETFQSDGTTAATDIMSGYKLIVTAEDASTTKTYTVSVDDALPGELIFSEYIEPDGGNSKAFEIFNPNDEAVCLDYYQLGQISNGGDDWEYFHIFPVGAVIEPHDVYIMVTSDTDDALFLKAEADEVLEYPSAVHHNGNDARGLLIVTAVDTTLIDIIGQIGADPGTGWDVAGVAAATANHTLVRKGSIMEGNADWASSAGTNADNSEWIVYDANFWDSLGTHVIVLPEPSDDATLNALTVDGTAVDGFSPAQLTYFVTLPNGTTSVDVVATATDGDLATVDISGPSDLGGDEAARTATITVTAEDGETIKTYTIVFTVEVGIENSVFSDVRVYPVPSSSKLYIDNISEVENMTVFDITGTAMMSIDNSGHALLSIDVSELNSGLYLVRMTSKKASGVVRFIKE